MSYSTVSLPQGAKLAYNVLGSEHVGRAQPIVLVGGMSSLRGDWERLSTALATSRPVLVFDHRGIGDSTYSNEDRNDDITIESMARDLLFLINSLGWRDLAICGFSMGGMVTQQLLLLPHHRSEPTPLPFRVSHVILAATMASPIRDRRFGLRFGKRPNGPLTEDQKREFIRPVVESTFDPVWLRNNDHRAKWWFTISASGRPLRTIMKQGAAIMQVDFGSLHINLPRDTHVLSIHGKLDQIVPDSYRQEIMQYFPQARVVEIGDRPGQIPNDQFGHHWWEYFDIQLWKAVVDTFLEDKAVVRISPPLNRSYL